MHNMKKGVSYFEVKALFIVNTWLASGLPLQASVSTQQPSAASNTLPREQAVSPLRHIALQNNQTEPRLYLLNKPQQRLIKRCKFNKLFRKNMKVDH